MNAFALLFLLGIITYLIVRRLASVTRTPAWLLWLVAMTPAFIWSIWGIVKGAEKTMPSELVVIPFIVCLVLYWCLIQVGRIPPSIEPANGSQRSPATKEVKPPSEIPAPQLLNKIEEANLKNCFPWSVYYLQQVEYRPQAVICRGQLRSSPEVAYRTIRENVELAFGNRFYTIFQEGASSKPFFALVTNPSGQTVTSEATSSRLLLALFLLAFTFCTSALAWLQIANPETPLSLRNLSLGIPYATTLLVVLGIHELGRYWVARRYQVRTTLPYFIPVLPLPLFPFGTFGVFTHLRSPIPTRRALFDIATVGALSALAVGCLFLWWGLAHSQVVPLSAPTPQFRLTTWLQAFDPRFSLLISLVSKLAIGSQLTAQTAITLHPVAVAAFISIAVTTFKLMPVGQLDGGRITHAMFGQRRSANASQVIRLLLFVLALRQSHLMVLAIMLFLLPATDEAALNDVTELDDRRYFSGLLVLLLTLTLILPVPEVIQQLLGM